MSNGGQSEGVAGIGMFVAAYVDEGAAVVDVVITPAEDDDEKD